MEKTTNYKLFKPELGDRVSIGDINENMDILDEKLKDVETVKIDKSRILSTKEELEAVTEPGFLVDALVAAQLNSDYGKWKLVGSVTGNTSVSLPNIYDELHIQAYTSNNDACYVFVVLYDDLTDTPICYTDGFGKANVVNVCQYKVSKATLQLFRLDINSVDKVSDTTTTVYYR